MRRSSIDPQAAHAQGDGERICAPLLRLPRHPMPLIALPVEGQVTRQSASLRVIILSAWTASSLHLAKRWKTQNRTASVLQGRSCSQSWCSFARGFGNKYWYTSGNHNKCPYTRKPEFGDSTLWRNPYKCPEGEVAIEVAKGGMQPYYFEVLRTQTAQVLEQT